jgi:hypothetical protein
MHVFQTITNTSLEANEHDSFGTDTQLALNSLVSIAVLLDLRLQHSETCCRAFHTGLHFINPLKSGLTARMRMNVRLNPACTGETADSHFFTQRSLYAVPVQVLDAVDLGDCMPELAHLLPDDQCADQQPRDC